MTAKKEEKAAEHVPGTNNKKCRRCIYHGNLANMTCCNYILIKHKKRPCYGGNVCTEFVEGEPIRLDEEY